MNCLHCGEFAPNDEIWLDEFCQECWERACSESWWNMLAFVSADSDSPAT